MDDPNSISAAIAEQYGRDNLAEDDLRRKLAQRLRNNSGKNIEKHFCDERPKFAQSKISSVVQRPSISNDSSRISEIAERNSAASISDTTTGIRREKADLRKKEKTHRHTSDSRNQRKEKIGTPEIRNSRLDPLFTAERSKNDQPINSTEPKIVESNNSSQPAASSNSSTAIEGVEIGKKKKRKKEKSEKKKSKTDDGKKSKKQKKDSEKSQESIRPLSTVVVVPPSFATVATKSRWEMEDDNQRSVSTAHHHVDSSRISSEVVRPSPAPVREKYRRNSPPSASNYSRHSLPPRSASYRRPIRDDRERHYSLKPRARYSGYDYYRRSNSPIPLASSEDASTFDRPSPPKDMPEHIRWLHERWTKYDRTFFTGGKKEAAPEIAKPAESTTASRKDEPAGPSSIDHQRGNRPSSSNDRPGPEPRRRHYPGGSKDRFSLPYYQFRKGGVYHHPFGGGPHQLLTMKEFIVTQPSDLANNEDEAVRLYNEYKLDYRRRLYADFFQQHQDDEWFMEKYHPMLKAEKERRRREAIEKRLDVFMWVC